MSWFLKRKPCTLRISGAFKTMYDFGCKENSLIWLKRCHRPSTKKNMTHKCSHVEALWKGTIYIAPKKEEDNIYMYIYLAKKMNELKMSYLGVSFLNSSRLQLGSSGNTNKRRESDIIGDRHRHSDTVQVWNFF